MKRNKHRVLPGYGVTLGYTMLYLSLIVLIPLSTIFVKATGLGWDQFRQLVTSPRVMASYRLSFGTALAAALINSLSGLLVAWVLVRYRFPFRKTIDGLIDLPFALPTSVAGIVLTSLYAQNGWIGRYAGAMGMRIAFTPLGIIIALVFIGLPFVVRTVQPVLQDLEQELEETAALLGANRRQIFMRVLLPSLFPALTTGFAMAFARGLGEYGSVVFISGNMPMKTEITPLLIVTKLEQFDLPGAAAIAAIMLVASFAFLLIINLLQWWSSRYRTAA
jgi:sulfate transport system permease protein